MFRVAERASHRIHINIITEKKEIKDPNDEMMFQVTKASG